MEMRIELANSLGVIDKEAKACLERLFESGWNGDINFIAAELHNFQPIVYEVKKVTREVDALGCVCHNVQLDYLNPRKYYENGEKEVIRTNDTFPLCAFYGREKLLRELFNKACELEK